MPDVDERVRPFGIAGKGDHLAFGLEAESEARSGAVVVHDVKRRYPQCADLGAPADFQFPEHQRKSQFQCLRSGKVDLHELPVARFETGRPGDGERAFALEHVVRVQHEERHATDVIGVKVREEDDVDVVAIDRELVHRNERGRAAIDEGIDTPSDEMEAGIESSARAEGIAAADELQMHGLSPVSWSFARRGWR